MADHTCNNHHTCSVKLDGISSIHFGSVAGVVRGAAAEEADTPEHNQLITPSAA